MELRGQGIVVNGKKLASSRVKLYVVCETEDGQRTKLATDDLRVNVAARSIEKLDHHAGLLNVKSKEVGIVASARPEAVHVDAFVVKALTCERIELHNCVQIGACYARSHNAGHGKPLHVRRRKMNPFSSPEREPRIQQGALEAARIALPSEKTNLNTHT